MKKISWLILLILFCGIAAAADEVRIYKGDSTYYGDCVATWKNDKLYKGSSTYSGDCVATYKDGKLYKGDSTYYGDCIFRFSSGVKHSPVLSMWILYHYFRILF